MYEEQKCDNNPATVATPRKQPKAETPRTTKIDQTNPNAVVDLAKQIIYGFEEAKRANHALHWKNRENDLEIRYQTY